MRWIAVGSEAEGVIAIGQFATGVFALGQVATGVVAVGQVARGFVAIGQVSIGVVAVGMGAVGVVGSAAMLGAGGRGKGIVLPLVPSLGPRYERKATIPASRLMAGDAKEGWIDARLEPRADGPVLVDGGDVEARFDVGLRPALEARVAPARVWARLQRDGDGWVCTELVTAPESRLRSPGWWGWWAVQLGLLGVACILFWVLAGIPVVRALFDPGGILMG